ncbi:malate dehydrogenase [Blattabacterium cuenoti]|uniref:malate dehydrogenase n=1 Tax=Blattabacterium cuenoti TaxID=1653831 RepID=UPI00163C554E|nr:malate dehydrogenase [Blattabacterium cuenoti]
MKVTIIGSGNVGGQCACLLACKNIVEQIVLLDINKGVSEGKSLDISQMLSVVKSDTVVYGYTNDYSKSKNSDIIVITCGITRKQGMNRDDLLNINAKIICSAAKNSLIFSPNAKFIIVSNPLDIMTYVSYITLKIDYKKVIGMAGILDIARYKFFLSKKLNISCSSIQSLLLGGHGDKMVPLYRYSSIEGIPLKEFLTEKENEKIVSRTKKGGEEIVNYLGTSAWMAPSISIVEMIKSILKNSRKLFCCSALLNGEYDINNLFLGVPVILGKNGVERVIELKLNNKEFNLLHESANHIKKVINKLNI